MAKPLPPSKPENSPEPEPRRRQSDLDGTESGVLEGGRRSTDKRAYVAPANKWATFWIVCSFLFSATLVFWSISQPYQAVFDPEKDATDSGLVNPVGLDYEERLTDKQYEEYMDQLDDELREQVREKNALKPVPSKQETRAYLQERTEKLQQKLDALKEAGFNEGTVEADAVKHLQRVVEDLSSSS